VRPVRRGLLAAGVAILVGGAAVVVASTAPEDARTDGWTTLTPAPLERTEVAAARIGRFIYVVGGFVPGAPAGRRAPSSVMA
jgi:hypothetical protein